MNYIHALKSHYEQIKLLSFNLLLFLDINLRLLFYFHIKHSKLPEDSYYNKLDSIYLRNPLCKVKFQVQECR